MTNRFKWTFVDILESSVCFEHIFSSFQHTNQLFHAIRFLITSKINLSQFSLDYKWHDDWQVNCEFDLILHLIFTHDFSEFCLPFFYYILHLLTQVQNTNQPAKPVACYLNFR